MNNLDDVFKSIYSAIVDSQQEIEAYYIGEVKKDYFDEGGNPRTTPVMLPTGEGGKMTSINIPLITLVPHHGMAIKEVEIEMKVAISPGDEKPVGGKLKKIRKFIADHSMRNKEMAKIRVVFDGKEPPEGLARIKDTLNKIIPN